MGPNGRTRTRATRRSSSRRKSSSQLKKGGGVRQKSPETTALIHSSPSKPFYSSNDDDVPKIEGIEYEAVDDVVSTSGGAGGGCSTPKGQRFRIPEVMTCPPAPKKQRVISNCSLKRSPIAFFAPPDLELFFFLAVRGISV